MRVCVVGSGGREHCLAHVLARTADVVVVPGNAGMARAGLALTRTDPERVEADLFVVGPEAPLVDGLADRLRGAGQVVFGPGADGALLEGSKAWMKDVLVEAGVPTAQHQAFTDAGPAHEYLESRAGPYVVKTDGLAAGKGVLVTESLAEARAAVDRYLSGEAFGEAGRTLVIEEGLTGPELSVLAVCDGERAVPLAPAQDFKRVGDGDVGPNTGGMGAYSPVPAAGPELVGDLMRDAVEPTLAALRARGIDYRGVLYAGLMLTPNGPKVLEYNVRFGDPEAQVVLPRLESDLAQLLYEAATGDLRTEPVFSSETAVTVALASEGYPDRPRTGDAIDGLASDGSLPEATLFFAGVVEDEAGRLTTSGGRVLYVTGFGRSLTDARSRAYRAVEQVSWPGIHYRRDIAEAAAVQEEANQRGESRSE